MPGRRWSDGLHQAVEAKEGVQIQAENQTLASITFQNYFRLYDKLSGMTGTADTEAFEFQPDLRPRNRGHPDQPPDAAQGPSTTCVYQTAHEKYAGRSSRTSATATSAASPVLVGTDLDRKLRDHLAAADQGRHRRTRCSTPSTTTSEAEIVAQAGRPGTVTIATNMAGRGTDIVLGGNSGSRSRRRASRRNPDRSRQSRSRSSCATMAEADHEQVIERRRPAHHRHRAPRIPPYRQPAARPFRPSGRPGLLAASTCRWKTA